MSAEDNTALALNLAAEGFQLIPLTANKKGPPLFSNWPNLATSDPETIRKWWSSDPFANIGIHCAAMAVLDVDPGKGGDESFAQLEKVYGFPPTRVHSTPSGGRHLFFKLPSGHPGVSNSVQTLGDGLDIRSTGGYVCGPGSKLPTGGYTVASGETIAEIPDWLLDKLGTARPKNNEPRAVVPDADKTIVERAREWLAVQEGAVEGQGGDARTYAVACGLRDLGISAAQSFELMLTWNERSSPPWEIDDLQEKVENAYRYAQNAAGSKIALPSDFSTVENEEPKAVESSAAPSERKALYAFPPEEGRLRLDLAIKPERRRYVVPGFVPAGITAILAGHGGSGKSLALLYFATAIALGRSLFDGMAACDPGAVLIALGEEDKAEAYRRLYAIAEQLNLPSDELELLSDRMLLFPCLGKDVRLTGHRAGVLQSTDVSSLIAERMNAHAEQCGLPPALVGLDHFLLFSGGEINSNEDAGAYARETGAIVSATGATVLSVAHSPKGDDGKKLDQHSVLGAVSTANLARLVLLVQRMTATEAKAFGIPSDERWRWLNLWTGKTNYTKAGAGVWLQECETEHETIVLTAAKPQRSDAEITTQAEAATLSAGEAVTVFLNSQASLGVLHSQKSLEEAAQGGRVAAGNGKSHTRAAVRAAVHWLVERGVIDSEAERPADKRRSRGPQTYLRVVRPLEILEHFQ